jgi:hypothetical protein
MSQKRPILRYVLAYLLWIISTGLGILVLNLMRETLLLSMVASAATGEVSASDKYYQALRVSAVYNWSILVIGVIVLIILVALEHFYRTAGRENKVWKLFFLISGIETTILLLTHITYFALEQSVAAVGWWGIAIPAAEALVAALFWWLYMRTRKKLAPAGP